MPPSNAAELGSHFFGSQHKIMSNAAVEPKTTNDKWKIGSNKKTRPRMNYEWIGKTHGNGLEKIPFKKPKKKQTTTVGRIALRRPASGWLLSS